MAKLEIDNNREKIEESVPKLIELLKEYSPSLASTMLGFQWHKWRCLLLRKHPELKVAFSTYLERTKINMRGIISNEVENIRKSSRSR